MSALRPELAAALATLYADARVETLPGDASARRFHRLFLDDGGSRIVMDYGAPFVDETDDVRLARIFERGALPVARVLDVLPDAGAIVLEDLGDTTLEVAVARDGSERRADRGALYRDAVRLAVAIGARGTAALSASERGSGPALDEERFRFEMDFFLRHYVTDYLGRKDDRPGLRDALYGLARDAAAHPRVLCHRDYHSRNIMVRSDGSLAMVDIQDARWGPDTYDLASLLRDAYVDLDEREADDLFGLYWTLLPGRPDRRAMRFRFELTSAQRMIKALGTFGYQVAGLGRSRYREALDRTAERLTRILPAQRSTLALFRELDGARILVS
ncbi:MAG TPA: phosphotransferase [Candidatus Polarisedimenticolaceae bacterium]|nr:phosphotransferase [Candidatus Polarisedimenticolaceae bacterium]